MCGDIKKISFLKNWKFLLLAGIMLSCAVLLLCLAAPWSWENIEKLRCLMGRQMNSEVYCYYSNRICLLMVSAAFTALYLTAAALVIRFLPEPMRRKMFPVLREENYSGIAGGLLIYILGLGTVVRLENYVSRSFWCDTLALTDAVMRTPAESLLSGPLPNMQSAPPGYLLLFKMLGETFGYTELIAGLPSCAAGIISLFLLYRLMKSQFGRETVLVMLFLFAVNPSHVYYSSEIKQYSFDVLFTILMLDYTLKLLRDRSARMIAKAAAAGIAAVLFSHAMFFVIPPLGAILFFHCLAVDRSCFFRISALNLVWAAAVLAGAVHALHVMPPGMYIWHQKYFAPIPHNWETAGWYWNIFRNIFCYPNGLTFPVPILNLIPFSLLLAGMIRLWKKNRPVFCAALLPLLLLLAASMLRHYPVECRDNVIFSRLILFTLPLTYFVFAAGLDWMHDRWKILFYIPAAFCAGSALLLFTTSFPIQWNLKPLCRILTANYSPGDKIYTSVTARWAIRIYSFPNPPPHSDFPVTGPDASIEWHADDAAVLFPKPGRYWIFLSLISNGEKMKDHLEKIGTLAAWHESGGILYRLDKKQ